MLKKSEESIQVIVGLGKTGLSCVRFLAAQNAQLAVTDSRENPPGLDEIRAQFPHIHLSLGKLDVDLCSRAARLIISPGVALTEPAITTAIAKNIPVIGDIELFASHAKAPIVAITGSNGKSTVTTLVGEMAKHAGWDAHVGGNLGTPALELLVNKTGRCPVVYVLELSSFQLETTHSLKPKAAVLLNLSEDHMDRYRNMADYLAAKQRVYHHCETTVINRDEPDIWKDTVQGNYSISFGLDEPQDQHFGLRKIQEKTYLAKGKQLLIETSALKIKGTHQLANALAALALGEALGLPMDAMIETLKTFTGLAHRCQWVATTHKKYSSNPDANNPINTISAGIDWYNDSKATNVGAAQAALNGLGTEISGRLVVIAGGQGKNADFTPLRTPLQKYARCLILIGEDAQIMENALADTTQIIRADNMEQAVNLAQQNAQPGDAVILAPACASLDMFKNFEHRGEVFMTLVKNGI